MSGCCGCGRVLLDLEARRLGGYVRREAGVQKKCEACGPAGSVRAWAWNY